MNEPLGKISILLLIFYMGWYLWEQNKVIQDQNAYIEIIEKELITRKLLLGEYNIQMLPKQDLNNPIHKPSI
tara:strand:+ start:524 stop:739 length:216 start_codon:yes stop_codon:yes gene_type:complete